MRTLRFTVAIACLALVAGWAPVWAIDFELDIIPVLTKAGCNTGACHGAAVGRGGFRLSLYGGDPEADFDSIVHELEGRRVNLADPEQSLVVLKPTETIEHGGGPRLDPRRAGARQLTDWIRQGALWNTDAGYGDAGPGDQRRLRLLRLSVEPQRVVVSEEDPTVRLAATAHFSDGTERDVTSWTVFTPEDPAAVDVDETGGLVTMKRRGRHVLVARYLSEVVPIELLFPLDHASSEVAASNSTGWPDSMGWIDRHVMELLQTLRLPASPAADDATFLRRVTLDLTGRLPSLASTQAFMSDRDPNRREQLVDRLLESEDFNEYWTLELAKLFRLRAQGPEDAGALAYHRWLHQQLEDRVGYDQMARALLTSLGDTSEVGPANFYRTVAGPREQAELASEVFMGNRLRCANCHNHPLDRWTQDDYHGLAAIFASVRSGQVISLDARGVVVHPKTGESAQPRIPGERFLDPNPGGTEDLRTELADWLTDAENPYFAKAIVNRLWKAMMGRGLVEPADDLRATNPATHPDLLDALAQDFVDHGYDLRHMLRLIALSDTYGRSADAVEGNETDDRYYSHFPRKPLAAEALADAISDVLELPEAYGDLPLGTRAVALIDPKTESRSLDILGRCSREDTCETSAGATSGGLTLKLHLFNGDLLNRRISDPAGRLAKSLRSGEPPMQVIDKFYLVALQRHPTEAETTYWKEQVGEALDRDAWMEDFVWSLLTCNEFTTNH